jgi:uroporphyrinogen decarboxylase
MWPVHIRRPSMTSRECVLAAVRHEQPDMVPVDLGATPSSGVSAIAYNNLKKRLGMSEGHTRVYDVVQELAQPEGEIIERFNIDVLDIGRMFNTADSDWHEIALSDGSRAEYPAWFHPAEQEDGSYFAYLDDGTFIAKKAKGATFFDQTLFPYVEGYPSDYEELSEAMGRVHWAALVHSPWDNAGKPGFWKELREKALLLRENTDKSLLIVCGCNLFEWGTFLRRIDNFLMDLALAKRDVGRLLDALMEQHLTVLAKVCDAVGDIADIVRFGDDLGTDQGPFMSPELYRSLFKPRHRKLCDYVKRHSDMHTFLHSCGSIYKLIPDLIDAGFEILNPVQTNARDMEPERLKREFGKDITFWGGGADTRGVLNNMKPREVKEHVKRRLEIFSPGGGFVFNPIHNILPDVPPENIVAMFEAVKSFGNP